MSRDQALDELAEAFALAVVNALVAQLEAASRTPSPPPQCETDERIAHDERRDGERE